MTDRDPRDGRMPMIDRVQIARTAALSPCGRYRHTLTRTWDARLPPLVWAMLNPSDADGERDDPTIRRVMAFSARLGFGGSVIVNLSDFRTPHPSALPRGRTAISPHNDAAIRRAFALARRGPRFAIAAWGNPPRRPWCAARIAHILHLAHASGIALHALGTTRHGHPKHPLARGPHHIPAATVPSPWRVVHRPRS